MPPRSPAAEVLSPVVPCPLCGLRVLQVYTDTGAKVPLDLQGETYLLRSTARQAGLPVADRSRSYARHTCRLESPP